MPRLLYLHPGLVPPPSDPRLDKFFYLSEILEGEVLLPVWWRDDADAKSALGDRFPVARNGRFSYHMLPASTLKGWRSSVGKLMFFVRKGLELHRHQPYDIIMTYGTNMPGVAGVILKLLTGAKLVPELPNVPEHQYRYTEPVFNWTARIKKWLSDALLHLVIFASDHVKVLYPTQLRSYPLLFRKPATVCHDLVPVNYISAGIGSVPENKGMVLLMGFPWFTKGVDVAIRAFVKIASRFPSYRLVIVGHSLDRAYLDKLAEGCTQIEFRNPVPGPEALRLISSCSVYLSASRTEGIARVLLEAMSASRPIVASAVGGTPFLLAGGDCALLFRGQDPDDLADRLTQMLSDPELASSLGEAAHRRVHAQFDERAYVREFGRLIDATLAR
jgi:glycosyltransferase involved in cell wall biosynthesis